MHGETIKFVSDLMNLCVAVQWKPYVSVWQTTLLAMQLYLYTVCVLLVSACVVFRYVSKAIIKAVC